MTAELNTVGEQVANRELKKERRAGVPHYVTGQHHAELLGRDSGWLTYVDVGGHVVLLAVLKVAVLGGEPEWRAVGNGARAGMFTPAAPVDLPPDFKLSEKMLAAIAAAEERGWGVDAKGEHPSQADGVRDT